ncbi:trypsin-3-like [Musca vetustissima]|uniref:trypsin-3-like n=1 Tax=Musca vetustissima TaxID=27455 RepID=UPI002AB6EF08|nr:trypsin-3-like [Musca vetustissima]
MDCLKQFSITFVLVVACISRVKSQGRVVNGAQTHISNLPYLVQLRILDGDRLFCGGALITYSHVVSAAHCVREEIADQMVAVAEATSIYEEGVKRRIISYLIHPEYRNVTASAYDIGVYKLESPMMGEMIRPVALCSRKMRTGDRVQVSGWGRYYEKSKPSTYVRTINVPVVDREVCKRNYLQLYGSNRITESMFCAAELGVKDACQGDSGGPAVFRRELCGIVSWVQGGYGDEILKLSEIKRPTIKHDNPVYIPYYNAPYMMQLRNADGEVICDGTLIRSQFVLTASHCFDQYRDSDIIVVGGATMKSDKGIIRKILHVYKHPLYNATNWHNDVAIIKLESNMDGGRIKPYEELCDHPSETNDFISITGWLRPNVTGAWVRDELRSNRFPIVTHMDCIRDAGSVNMEITASMFCGNILNHDGCLHNSGGPAISYGQICGITLGGENCNYPKFPGAYTSVFAVHDFILDAIGESEYQ